MNLLLSKFGQLAFVSHIGSSCINTEQNRICLAQACKDYHACKWPEELSNKDTSLASYFDAMNEDNMDVMEDIKKTCEQIITFSHFVPR